MGMSRKAKGALGLATTSAVGLVAVSVLASPAVVTGGRDTFRPNRTKFSWSTSDQQTSSTEFKRLPDFKNFPIKHYGPLVATVTVQVSGDGPAQFRLATGPFKPKRVTFDPSSTTRPQTFSFTAVLQRSGWSCSDAGLLWRSPSGTPLKLHVANVVVDHKRKNEEPDFGCR